MTEIKEIKADRLTIDEANIRGTDWVSDEELIESIKEQGVIEPLIIRKADTKEKADFTIVCGSRRWRASLEAGLKAVPCIIKDLTTAEAIGLSITENRNRKDIPVYRYVEAIGKMAKEFNGNMTKEEKIKVICKETKLSRWSIRTYLNVLDLPMQILELLKPADKRSPKVVALLAKFGMDGTSAIKELSIHKAEKIAKELGDFPMEKLLETAIVVIDLSREKAFEVIEKIKTYPMLSPQEVYEKKVLKIPFGARWQFNVGSHIVTGMDDACVKEGGNPWKVLLSYLRNL